MIPINQIEITTNSALCFQDIPLIRSKNSKNYTGFVNNQKISEMRRVSEVIVEAP